MANSILKDRDAFERGETGFYDSVSDEDYFKKSALSATALKAMYPFRDRCIPAYAKWSYDNPREDTDSLSLGRSCHLALFERPEFDKLIVMPEFIGKTKDGKDSSRSAEAKELKEKWLKENEGRQIIEKSEQELSLQIAEQCYNTKSVRTLLEKPSYNELVGLWTDKETGLLCKIKLDRFLISDGVPTIIDAKTTGELYGALPELFSRRIFEYKYHIQKAFYIKGVREIMNWTELNRDSRFKKPVQSIIIVIETKGARLVNAQYLHEEWITEGTMLCVRAMKIFKECKDSDNWYGFPDQILANAPSKWMFSNQE